MDCFYAAIEQRDDPSLANQPVAVGGRPHSRGVIATCNYDARRYGVHSAMPSAHAAKLCPHLIFVKPNMAKYKHESQTIRSIFNRYSDLVEPLSLDEAYLDISASRHCHGSATWIAQSICKDIYNETGLTASAGVATNKFLAKIASDWNKPAGIKVILPEEEFAFIKNLPVKKLHGVGKVMATKLEAIDIFSCHELRQVELNYLIKKFGKTGKYLYDLCRGIDNREVKPFSNRKSLSVETTFEENIKDWFDCENELLSLVSSLSRRLELAGCAKDIRKIFVKIKMENFVMHSAETLANCLDVKGLMTLFKTLRESYPSPIRLLGIGVRFAEPLNSAYAKQLELVF